MTTPILECIANYSEARRPQVVEAISEAITSVEGVSLLDRHSDLDHNRTVLTFIGPPAEVSEAAFRSIAKAAELINLDEHQGEHPRIGATDVVPFVPISGLTMQDSVQIARQLGKRVGDELGIPVYLYEEAATRSDRKNLEDIRRGQYEGLKEEIQTNPNRLPDFGPQKVGSAGAVVIGARQPLIAYNVYLTSDDLSIAEKIARAVRHSSGGLRYVKALGMLVDGRAQVSMNLTNFHRTPLTRVVELIRSEAERYGVGIHHSELVGLIPQEALVDAAVWHLQMDQFEKEQILENRVFAISQENQGPPQAWRGFLDELAAGTAAPGGGSAAAYAGAMGAALVAMVARLTLGKKKYAQVENEIESILQEAEKLRARLIQAVQDDIIAFEAVMSAYKLPKNTPELMSDRQKAIETATLDAAKIPLEVAQTSHRVLQLALRVISIGNLNAISDGASGAAMAGASLASAGYNVRINVASLNDQSAGQALLRSLEQLEQEALAINIEIRKLMVERGGLG